MQYIITLRCVNEKDASTYDRELKMNSYESAIATFKTLVKGCLEDLVDPYVIEFYYGSSLRYKVESLKI